MNSIHGSDRLRASDGDDVLSVSMPSRPWVMPLGFAAAVLLGGAVFWQLNANRTKADAAWLTDPEPNTQNAVSLDNVPPPPDLFALAAAEGDPGATMSDSLVSPPMPQQSPPADLHERLRSPVLVVDLSQAGAPQTAPQAGGERPAASLSAGAVSAAVGAGSSPARNPNEEFARRLGADDTAPVRAQRMQSQGFTITQGAMIPAVLETALNSDLPGYARAIVSRDVHSFDGKNVLVPRGSRLVGQYRSGVALGQSRAFVIWTRLIRPDGITVELAAPGTDALGRGGLEGRVDRHFIQRFGGAILLSLITAGAQLATESSDTQVIIASTTGAAGNAASVALQADLNIAPTVRVPQGAPIRVFVTRDLDFSILREEE